MNSLAPSSVSSPLATPATCALAERLSFNADGEMCAERDHYRETIHPEIQAYAATNPEPQVILIVEDESDLAKLLQWTLESRGYQAVLAGDGRAALFQAHRRKPDLLILDLMLPELHGFDVCRALKASELTKRIPIIALTALTSTEDKVKGLALGLDDYITKPFEMRELIARVEVGLRRSREPANVSIS